MRNVSLGIVGLLLSIFVMGQTYTVTNTNNYSDWRGPTVCSAPSWSQPVAGSLMKGIFEANSGNYDRIVFQSGLTGTINLNGIGWVNICTDGLVIDGSAAPGVNIQLGSSAIHVRSNDVEISNLNVLCNNSTRAAFQIIGNDNSLSDVTITHAGLQFGIIVEGDNNNVTDVDISNTVGVSITGDDNSFDNVNINSTGNNYSLNVRGSRNVFENADIINPKGSFHTVFILGANDNIVRNNNISRSIKGDWMGVYIGQNSSRNVIEGNSISGQNKSAIEILSGDNNQIIRNEITGFFNYGIAITSLVSTATNTLIDGNAIHSSDLTTTGLSRSGIINMGGSQDTKIINNIIGSDFNHAAGIGGIYGDGIIISSGSVVIGESGNGNHIVSTGNSYLGNLGWGQQRGRGIIVRRDESDNVTDQITAVIQANVIGTDWATQSIVGDFGNDCGGIELHDLNPFSAPPGTPVGLMNITIGGTTDAEANIIGNNGYRHKVPPTHTADYARSGINFEYFIGTAVVQNNYLGTNRSGADIGNNAEGVTAYGTSEGNRGSVLVTGNDIAFNGNGVASRYRSTNVTIQDNDIFSNEGAGVIIEGSTGTLVGGDLASNGNRIYENQTGVQISNDFEGRSSSGNELYNNNFGNYDGTHGENVVNAVYIANGSQLNIIGAPGKGNVIKNKTVNYAIQVDGSTAIRNRIQGNTTSGNGVRAIDLENTGNKNYGANNAVSFNTAESRLNIISGRAPKVGDIVDIYVSIDGTCQAPGSGVPQGAIWVASVTAVNRVDYSLDYSGPIWEYDLTDAAATSAGLTFDNAVVTATEGDGSSNLSTSEFAQCLEELSCNQPANTSIVDPGVSDFCNDNGSGQVTLRVPVQTGFEYIWFRNGVEVQAQSVNNQLIVTESGDYTVQVVDPLDIVNCNVMADNTVTLTRRENPTIDGNITGDEDVCLSTYPYELTGQSLNYDEIIWSSLNNGATYVGGSGEGENVQIDFSSVTDLNTPIEFSVTLYKEYPNGVVCASDASSTKVVNVTDPKVLLDNSTYSVLCGSTGNRIVEITNYDSSPGTTYVIDANTAITGVTVTGPDSQGFLTLNVSDNASGGSISVTIRNSSGCEHTETFDVVVTGCGREVIQQVNTLICGAGDILLDGSQTVAGTNVNHDNSIFTWTLTETTGNTGINFNAGPYSGSRAQYESFVVPVTTVDGEGPWSIEVLLEVEFEDDPSNPISDVNGLDVIEIGSTPTINLNATSFDLVCNTSGNRVVEIQDYNSNWSYTINAHTASTGVTVSGPDLNGFLTLDLSADARGGSIDIIVENGSTCTETSSFNVVVTGCGRRVVQNVTADVCGAQEIVLDGSATFAGDGVDHENSVFKWTVTKTSGGTGITNIEGVYEGLKAGFEIVNIPISTDPGAGPWEYEVILEVTFENDPVPVTDAQGADVIVISSNPALTLNESSFTLTCGSSANTVLQVTDYSTSPDLTYEAVVNSSSTGLTVTGPDPTGFFSIDVADNANGGDITIRVTNSTSGCISEQLVTINVVGCGRRVVQSISDAICGTEVITLDGSNTEPGDGVNHDNSIFTWTLTETTGNPGLSFNPGPYSGSRAQYENFTVPVTTTNGLGPWEVSIQLEVSFEDDPGTPVLAENAPQVVTIYSSPEASWTITEDQGECFRDTITYQVSPFDHTKYDYTDLVNLTDLGGGTYEHVNGVASYTSSLVVSNKAPNLACPITLQESRTVRLTPSVDLFPISGSSSFCDENSSDSLYKFVMSTNNVSSIRWDIDPYVNPYDGQDRNDTVGYVFPEGQGQYTLTAIGYVDATACASADSIVDVFTINVDRSYLVDVTASPVEDLYCEGDNGQFRGEVLVDSMGTFGTGYYSSAHYSELFWDYYSSSTLEKELNQSDNIEVRYISDTIINGNDTSYLYSTDFVTIYDLSDTTGIYADAISISNTRDIGALNFEDSVIFRVEPQHCYTYNSILSDTLLGDSVLQAKTEIDVVVNQDDVHVIDNVINTQYVDISDNLNEVITDGAYFLFQGIDGDTNYVDNKQFVGDFNNIEVPEGVTSVLYLMILEQGVCTSVDSAQLILNYEIFIPDMFSPNGDGFYDELVIENIDLFPNNKVEIYNRWGSLLYEANDYSNNQWDGTHKGNELPVASYYVVVDLGNGSDPISQTVSIFK